MGESYKLRLSAQARLGRGRRSEAGRASSMLAGQPRQCLSGLGHGVAEVAGVSLHLAQRDRVERRHRATVLRLRLRLRLRLGRCPVSPGQADEVIDLGLLRVRVRVRC